MTIVERLRSMLGSRERPTPVDEIDVEYECTACGARFNEPAGAGVCPECYEPGIKLVE